MTSLRILLAFASVAVSIAPLTAQPRGRQPGGGRPGGGGLRGEGPAILEVTGERVAKLNPVAKLVKERRRLELTDRQSVKLDSIAAALEVELAPFLRRIDSLKPGGRGGFRPPRDSSGGRSPGNSPLGGPMAELVDALAQVELRYQAGLQSVLRSLTDDQAPKAAKLVDKEVTKMKQYSSGGFGRFRGPP